MVWREKIPCAICGNPIPAWKISCLKYLMQGTQLCEDCWYAEEQIRRLLRKIVEYRQQRRKQ